MFQFIHAADLHLDSPLKGLIRFEDALVDRIQKATRVAFSNLVDLAIKRQVAFVLISGDLWDGEWPDSGPGFFFLSETRRLGKAGIRVYAIKGNHDAASKITPLFKWPEYIHFFSDDKPETKRVPGLDVYIHGQSYSEQNIRRDLSAAYPKAIPHALNIGMLHTCLEDGADYAPASLDKLVEHGYEYWALGHVHNRRQWDRNGVHIEFPGNLQGRSMSETDAKGCTVVTVGDDFGIAAEFVALDDVRWLRIEIDAQDSDLESCATKALREAVKQNDNQLLAVRMVISGQISEKSLRERLTAVAIETGSDIWIEQIQVRQPPQPTPLLTLNTELRKLLWEAAGQPFIASELSGSLASLKNALPEECAISFLRDDVSLAAFAAAVAKEF